MKVYTYSEARQRLARLLDEAREGGEIRIKRRDGSEFAVLPVRSGASPLDVPGIDTGLSREDIVAAVRESRERDPTYRVRPGPVTHHLPPPNRHQVDPELGVGRKGRVVAQVEVEDRSPSSPGASARAGRREGIHGGLSHPLPNLRPSAPHTLGRAVPC
jgi:antitoxin (DNA-binding transcriptional repressor) of toxin-antitoxin stability system